VVWGALNGVYLVIEMYAKNVGSVFIQPVKNILRIRLIALGQILLTFTLICLAWVFFRAESFHAAMYIIGNMFTGWTDIGTAVLQKDFAAKYMFMGRSDYDFYWAVSGILGLLVAEYWYIKGYIIRMLSIENLVLRYTLHWFLIATALLLIIIFAKTESQQFIYFQF
jgi:hypothetical protein